MYSPALAVLVALLVTPMSADRVTVVLAVSVSLAVLASAGLWPLRVAVLLMLDTVEEGLIWARILTVVEALAASGPTARLPVQALFVTSVASQLAPVLFPSTSLFRSSVSLRVTALLSDGPWLVTT